MVWPETVTCFSCMASSRAAWVFGGVRLISSARMRLAKMGPRENSKRRVPSPPVCRISLPTMSVGIRSGVNWMRWKERPSTLPKVLTRRVLASPGTPTIRQCPRQRRATSICSTTSCWPTTVRAISARMLSMLACILSQVAVASLIAYSA